MNQLKSIEHRSSCTDPADLMVRRGQYGDTIEACRTCSRFRVIESDPESEPRPTSVVVPCACCGTFLPHRGHRPALRYCSQKCARGWR